MCDSETHIHKKNSYYNMCGSETHTQKEYLL